MSATQSSPTTAPDVDGPLSLSPAQWLCVLQGVQATAERANLALISAGIAFFGLMAVIPGIAALVALVGLFGDPALISEQVRSLYGIAPDTVVRAIDEQLARLLTTRSEALALSAIISVMLSLWGALQGMRWLLISLTAVNRRSEKRKALRRYIAAGRFTLAAIALTALAILLMGLAPLALAALNIESHVETLVLILRWPVLGSAGVAVALMLYRWGPRRRPPPWRWLWPGAVAAPVLWLAASSLLTWALRLFPSFGATYGSLASAVVLLVWFYITALVFLVCGALNAELEFFAQGKSTAPVSEHEKIAPPIQMDGGAQTSN